MPSSATSRPNLRSARIVDGRSGIAGLVICWLLVGSALPASAAVYLDDAVIDDTTNIPTLAFPPWTGMGRVLHLTQSPNGFVVVEVNRIGSTANFEFIYQSIAGAYGLCQVSSGEELTYLNLASKSGLGGWGGGNTLTLNPGQEAYIGYWSQRNGKPIAPPEANDIYGWARVTNTAGNLVLISSASADTGIIVGTTQAIPEPGPALLASAASLLLFRHRRNREGMITNRRTGNCHLSQSNSSRQFTTAIHPGIAEGDDGKPGATAGSSAKTELVPAEHAERSRNLSRPSTPAIHPGIARGDAGKPKATTGSTAKTDMPNVCYLGLTPAQLIELIVIP